VLLPSTHINSARPGLYGPLVFDETGDVRVAPQVTLIPLADVGIRYPVTDAGIHVGRVVYTPIDDLGPSLTLLCRLVDDAYLEDP
jgi:hypothetical protein